MRTTVQDKQPQGKGFNKFPDDTAREQWLKKMVLITGRVRGGLSYPTFAFVGLVSHLERSSTKMASILVKELQPFKKFASHVPPSVAIKTFFFRAKNGGAVTHKMVLLELAVTKFTKPLLSNFTHGQIKPQAKRLRFYALTVHGQ